MPDARLENLRSEISNRRLDAFLVTNISNVFYLSGFTGDTGELIITADSVYLLVDPRFTVQAKAECGKAKVVEYTGKTGIAAAADLLNELGPSSAGYESDTLTVTSYRELRSLTDKSISLRATRE